MAWTVPNIRLNSGHNMPMLGMGTWKVMDPDALHDSLHYAIDAGYRHIDCAMIYRNEVDVGSALKAVYSTGIVQRDDMFLTSKLWCSYRSRELIIPALQQTLKDLQTDHLDMFLIHWPFGFQEGGDLIPVGWDENVLYSDVDYMETWQGMEDALRMGLTRSIGVSNFNSEMIQRILTEGTIPPATNQVEVHPYFNNSKLVDFCQQRGIAVTGFSPFASPDRQSAAEDEPKLLLDRRLIELGKKYHKSPAQIALRWGFQRNVITIPKAVNALHLEENINIFDFSLTEHDVNYMNTFDRNGRTGLMKNCTTHKYYPFHSEF